MAYASDPAAATAAYVAEKLKLSGNPYHSVKILTEKDLLHDYVFDALKAVENLNLDDVINGFYDWHKGKVYITLKRDDFKEYLDSLKK